MKKTALIVLGSLMISTPALAIDHGCGARPTAPDATFDPTTATKEEVLEVKAAFEAYQAENTTYLDCIETYSKSEIFAKMDEETKQQGINEMNAELRTVQEEEQAFADNFNENARAWVKVQSSKDSES